MGAWADYDLPVGVLHAQDIDTADGKLLDTAKQRLRNRLRIHAAVLFRREGVTETAFYDEIVGDLAATHDVIAHLDQLLAAEYFIVHFRRTFSAVGNADEARFMLYEQDLRRENLLSWVEAVRLAIDQEELVFESADVTRDEIAEPVTWI